MNVWRVSTEISQNPSYLDKKKPEKAGMIFGDGI